MMNMSQASSKEKINTQRQNLAPEKARGFLRFLYKTILGRACLKILTRPFVSKTVGAFMSSRMSRPLIKGFVKKNGINLSDFEERRYHSYNDFFTRKIKTPLRPVDMNPKSFISPCDGKLSVFEIKSDCSFVIKDSLYTPPELIKNCELASKYAGGYCIVVRLCVDDYHRYCYIDDGTREKEVFIKGILHTVRPAAFEKYKVFKQNSREYTLMHTQNFGDVVQIEVGAMMVGRIVNNDKLDFLRGEEKGYFEFGGSTIVLFVEKDKVAIDDDILQNSENDYETIVKCGEKIGVAI